jgi:RNA polymerase sigma-70 factor (ECF subfamily)
VDDKIDYPAEPESHGLPEGQSAAFITTKWTQVGEAGAGASEALEWLCRNYWPPVYAFARRKGWNHEDARDLTQEFFSFLLQKQVVKKADRAKGKFRTFLLAAFQNFLSNEWDKRQTWKRGGRHQFIPLDEFASEERLIEEFGEAASPEQVFERRWAEMLVEKAIARLGAEYTSEGKADLFTVLRPNLTASGSESAAKCAAKLHMTVSAVGVALHRLRQRFREALRREITPTVAARTDIDDELRYLINAITG